MRQRRLRRDSILATVEGSMVLIYIGSGTQVHKACTVYVRPSVIIHIRGYPDFILFTQPSHIVQVCVVPVGRQCGFLCDIRADELTYILWAGLRTVSLLCWSPQFRLNEM